MKKDPTKRTLGFDISVKVANGELTQRRLESTTPKLLEPRLRSSQLKVWEARYFLRLLRKHANDEAALLYHLDAFLTALRAITFVLQKEGAPIASFKEWYEKKQVIMRAHPDLPLFIKLRNESEKEGFTPPVLKIVTRLNHHRDGSQSIEKLFSIHGRLLEDPFTRMENALHFLQLLVTEAIAEGHLGPEVTRMAVPFEFKFRRENEDGTWSDFEPEDFTASLRMQTASKKRGLKMQEWDFEG